MGLVCESTTFSLDADTLARYLFKNVRKGAKNFFNINLSQIICVNAFLHRRLFAGATSLFCGRGETWTPRKLSKMKTTILYISPHVLMCVSHFNATGDFSMVQASGRLLVVRHGPVHALVRVCPRKLPIACPLAHIAEL